MWDRGAVKFMIYQRLNKSPLTPGFYTAEKMDTAIQEALDFVATEMFDADGGWLKKIDYLTIEANSQTVPIPPHMEMIESVRYLVGNVYTPLTYDARWNAPEWSVQSGATQLPNSYRIVDNRFYFNPALAVGGDDYLQIEFMQYPSILRSDQQKIDTQFGRALIWYVVYRAMSILASAMGQAGKSWQTEEALWYQKMLNVVNKRNSGTTAISEFAGY